MGSIPPKTPLADELRRIINDSARKVAVKERLPWGLSRLRESGRECLRTASEEIIVKSRSLGMPAKDVAVDRVYEAACRAAKELRSDAEAEKPLPTDEQMEDALDEFTIDQWETFVEEFGQKEADALVLYINSTNTAKSRARYERLKREIGTKKLHDILAVVVQRSLELWSETERQTTAPITDPYWTAVWREEAREANRSNDRRTADGRSVDEATSARSIAERLNKKRSDRDKVNPRQVGTWPEKMKSLTFEQFFADKVTNEEYDPELDYEQKRAIAWIEYHALVRKKYVHWPYK